MRKTASVLCLLAVLSACSSSEERSSPYSDINARYGSSASSSSQSSSASDNPSSGNDSRGDGFESLVSMIEEGEAIMIVRFEIEDEYDLIGCGDRYGSLYDDECSGTWAGYVREYAATARVFRDRYPGLKAELSALVLSGEHPDALRAREAYIGHLEVWTDFRSAWASRFPSRLEATSTNPQKMTDFLDWGDSEGSRLNERIGDTFTETCVALGNSQPSDGSYSERIRNICDNVA